MVLRIIGIKTNVNYMLIHRRLLIISATLMSVDSMIHFEGPLSRAALDC